MPSRHDRPGAHASLFARRAPSSPTVARYRRRSQGRQPTRRRPATSAGQPGRYARRESRSRRLGGRCRGPAGSAVERRVSRPPGEAPMHRVIDGEVGFYRAVAGEEMQSGRPPNATTLASGARRAKNHSSGMRTFACHAPQSERGGSRAERSASHTWRAKQSARTTRCQPVGLRSTIGGPARLRSSAGTA